MPASHVDGTLCVDAWHFDFFRFILEKTKKKQNKTFETPVLNGFVFDATDSTASIIKMEKLNEQNPLS